jgi:hypothetical protein
LSTTVTPELIKYHVPVFWDDEYKQLDYINESFNDPASVELWTSQGYANQFTGDMCDMRGTQPRWNKTFIDIYTEMGWKDIGTSYYRMTTGTTLPLHSDLYVRYIELFGLAGQEHRIRRAVIFLEDWRSGHYFEGAGQAVTGWRAGDAVEWTYDLPHMAANVGLDPRYTLQITGWV